MNLGAGVEVEHFSNESKVFAPTSRLTSLQTGPELVKTRNSFQARVCPWSRSSRVVDQNQSFSIDKARHKHVWLRCGIAVLACICLLWTVWLILLTVAPNDTINRIMHTETFDEGAFWLLVDTPSRLLWPTVFGLAAVIFGYFATIIQVFQLRRKTPRTTSGSRSVSSFNAVKSNMQKLVVNAVKDGSRNRITSSTAKMVVSLSQRENSKRKLANICIKMFDLAIEVVLLFQILEAGTPVILVAIFTISVTANAVSCIIMMFLPGKGTGLTEILLDILFDFLIAVGYPLIVLVYCFSTFKFDYDKLAINLQVFPAGWFEQYASVIADPVQTDIIHKSLKLLRVESALDILVRVGVNLIFSFRLYRFAHRIQRSDNVLPSVYPKRHHVSAVMLLAFVVVVAVFVEESIRTSTLACEPHPECVVKAHRWTFVAKKSDGQRQCPCLTLIDSEIAPKTFTEWMNPINVTEKVAKLATAGDLQTIKLVNRYLPALPEELRKCTKMTHLSLIYTHTATMPVWMREFTKLQYIHVEGTPFSSLVSLPPGLFDEMSSLTFIHFGTHPPLLQLPSFDGLTSLKSLTLALLFSLTELPSLDKLANLERVVITSLSSIKSLPDLSHLKKLTALAVVDRASWCCNGFLGDCDLQSPHCQPRPLWGTPAASCLAANRTDDRPTQGTIDVLKKYSTSICGGLILPGTAEGPPTQEGMDQCNGTLYRECKVPGHREAMCYSARLMGISCSVNPYPIEMRRQQIRRGVGDSCDPDYEAWLGCRNH